VFAFLAASLNYGSAFVFIATSSAITAYLLIWHIPETGAPTARRKVRAGWSPFAGRTAIRELETAGADRAASGVEFGPASGEPGGGVR
jgi:hypothetical protein